jgi:hypothetical protein
MNIVRCIIEPTRIKIRIKKILTLTKKKGGRDEKRFYVGGIVNSDYHNRYIGDDCSAAVSKDGQ